MSKILLLGDVHGKWHNIDTILKQLDFGLNIKFDSAIQVGDFGFYPIVFDNFTNMKYDHNKTLKFHKKVYCIDGNHEDHKWLKNTDKEIWKETHNIYYQPRGSFIEIDGCKIGFIGGALNADRSQEGSTKDQTTNYILRKEVDYTVKAWNDAGGMDIVISHSCPAGLKIGMEGHPALFNTVQKYIVEAGHGDNDFFDCGEHALTNLYKRLNKKPLHWIYGHFHTVKQKLIDNTNFWCIGCADSSDGHKYINPFILNTKTKDIEFINKMVLNFDGLHSTRIY
jgi:predicted phosphodiesterase